MRKKKPLYDPTPTFTITTTSGSGRDLYQVGEKLILSNGTYVIIPYARK